MNERKHGSGNLLHELLVVLHVLEHLNGHHAICRVVVGVLREVERVDIAGEHGDVLEASVCGLGCGVLSCVVLKGVEG